VNREHCDPNDLGLQTMVRQHEPDCRELTFGEGKTDVLLNPWHSLVRINRGPLRPHKPFGDNAFRAMQTCQKYALRSPTWWANTVPSCSSSSQRRDVLEQLKPLEEALKPFIGFFAMAG
jgi:hypothetical protein